MVTTRSLNLLVNVRFLPGSPLNPNNQDPVLQRVPICLGDDLTARPPGGPPFDRNPALMYKCVYT